MSIFSRALRLVPAVVLVIGLIAGGRPVPASATTGPSYFLPPSQYHVANRIMALYRGQYILKSVERASRISGAAMGIEVDGKGFLTGIAQFYGYDAQGYQTTWVASMYNFRLTAHDRTMVFDLLGPTGKPLLGRMAMVRSSKGDLAGRIAFPSGASYAISFRKLS